jgi:hypothetical protein
MVLRVSDNKKRVSFSARLSVKEDHSTLLIKEEEEGEDC